MRMCVPRADGECILVVAVAALTDGMFIESAFGVRYESEHGDDLI